RQRAGLPVAGLGEADAVTDPPLSADPVGGRAGRLGKRGVRASTASADSDARGRRCQSSAADDHPVNHKHDNRPNNGYDQTPYIEARYPLCAQQVEQVATYHSADDAKYNV